MIEIPDATQQRHDSLYWQNGKCCAGCDHWRSMDPGLLGRCGRSANMSGHQAWALILRGPVFDLDLEPGQLVTRENHVCGQFQDDFDWSTLPKPYLRKIGALAPSGKLHPKPNMDAE